MRGLERSGQLILGLAILLIFGFLLPETERMGVTYLAALLLGLLAFFEKSHYRLIFSHLLEPSFFLGFSSSW
jgi:hypothetical protein